jgi:hypothetical protein
VLEWSGVSVPGRCETLFAFVAEVRFAFNVSRKLKELIEL